MYLENSELKISNLIIAIIYINTKKILLWKLTFFYYTFPIWSSHFG